MKDIKNEEELIKKSKEFKEMINSKGQHQIRILESIFVMIDTYCEDKIINPSQYASEKLALAILKDSKNDG